MKVLITKDEHLGLGFRNKFRQPGWEKDVEFKHQFIINYMNMKNIHYKLTTGDIFDHQTRWSFKQFLANKKLLEKYKKEDLKIISTAGNHDMMEGRKDIKESVFEEMVNDNLIIYPEDDSNILIDEDGNSQGEVHIIPYRYILNTEDKDEYFNEITSLLIKNDNLNQFLIIHQNITPDERENITEFQYDEITKACEKKGINILIAGHYHVGFPTIKMNNVLVINPWNLWRVVRDYETREDEHKPEFVILDLQTLETEHVEIPYKKYEEAFNLMEVDTYKKLKEESFTFFETFKDINIENVDEKDINILQRLKKELVEKLNIDENSIKDIFLEIDKKLN